LRPSLEATWIYICGALASGLAGWPEGLGLLAGWLVVDVALGHVFRRLLALKAPLGAEAAAGDRWRRLRAAAETQGPLAIDALAACGITLVLATYVGRQPLLVAALALFGGGLAALLAGADRAALERALAGLHVSAAWLMGHAALAPLTGASWGLALVVGLATYARRLPASRLGGARWLLRWAWAIWLLASIEGRQPLVTVVVAVGALAELMNEGLAEGRATSLTGLVRQRASWWAATVLVALASTRWG
jgi:hypothetical protein